MSDLVRNHIVDFPTRRLIYCALNVTRVQFYPILLHDVLHDVILFNCFVMFCSMQFRFKPFFL